MSSLWMRNDIDSFPTPLGKNLKKSMQPQPPAIATLLLLQQSLLLLYWLVTANAAKPAGTLQQLGQKSSPRDIAGEDAEWQEQKQNKACSCRSLDCKCSTTWLAAAEAMKALQLWESKPEQKKGSQTQGKKGGSCKRKTFFRCKCSQHCSVVVPISRITTAQEQAKVQVQMNKNKICF